MARLYRHRLDFNPRPPRGGRLSTSAGFAPVRVFQSTPPARGATVGAYCPLQVVDISIHAPREGGDLPLTNTQSVEFAISIHAPREGGDLKSRWGEAQPLDFNPRPPRGGRRETGPQGEQGPQDFNPRPPRGGATDIPQHVRDELTISIHAPREGGDSLCELLVNGNHENFNPRPPRGGRPNQYPYIASSRYFNPRPPRGGRQLTVSCAVTDSHFNPRPPRGGRRWSVSCGMVRYDHFNPRPPRGGRRPKEARSAVNKNFNPRPPRGGRRQIIILITRRISISIHAPREGGDYSGTAIDGN